MKAACLKGCWHGTKQLTTLFFVVVMIVGLLTLLMPFANEYRDSIAAKISQVLQHPVSIGYLEVEWADYKLKPEIIAKNVRIDHPSTHDGWLTFDQIAVKINPWKSLLYSKLAIDNVAVSGSHLRVVRGVDRKIRFAGLPTQTNTQTQEKSFDTLLQPLAGMSFQLNKIKLDWVDELIKENYRLNVGNVNLYIGQQELALQAEINPPRSVGDTVILKMVAQGPANAPLQWNSRYYLKGQQINLAALPYLRDGALSQADSGLLDFEVWGNNHPQLGFEVEAKIDLKNAKILAPTTLMAAQRIGRIKRLNTNLRFSGTDSNWELVLAPLLFETPEKRWPDSQLQINYHGDDERYSGRVEYVDLQTLATLMSVMPGMSDAQLKQLVSFKPVGELKTLDFTFPRKKPTLENVQATAKFRQLGWSAHTGVPGVQGLEGTFQLQAAVGRVQLASNAVVVDAPALFDAALPETTLQAEMAWQLADSRWELLLDNLSLANADFIIQGAAKLNSTQGNKWPDVTAEFITPGVALRRVPQYVPFSILPQSTAQWLRQAFTYGRAENIRFTYAGPLTQQAFKKGTATMLVEADIAEASLKYGGNKWPEVFDVMGNLRFDNAALSVHADSAQLLGAKVTTAQLRIPDLFRAQVELNGRLEGQLPQLLSFVEKSPVGHGIREFLAGVDSAGETAFDLDLILPLTPRIKAQPKLLGKVTCNHCKFALPAQDVFITKLSGELEIEE
jgi:uncharacterized protein YhdP